MHGTEITHWLVWLSPGRVAAEAASAGPVWRRGCKLCPGHPTLRCSGLYLLAGWQRDEQGWWALVYELCHQPNPFGHKARNFETCSQSDHNFTDSDHFSLLRNHFEVLTIQTSKPLDFCWGGGGSKFAWKEKILLQNWRAGDFIWKEIKTVWVIHKYEWQQQHTEEKVQNKSLLKFTIDLI